MVPIWKEKGKNNSDFISKLKVLENKVYEKVEETFINWTYLDELNNTKDLKK